MQHFKNIFFLYKLYKKKGVDLVHGHGAQGGVYARILGKLLGAKVLYTPHGGSLHEMHGKIKNKIYALIEKFLYFFTDLFIFESRYSETQFRKKVKRQSKKFVLNINGVEIPKSVEPKVPTQKFVIGAFGALRYIKGYDLLIEALSVLRNDLAHFELRLYGDGEERKTLEKLVKQKKLENHVHFIESAKSVEQIMRQCDVVVIPSRFESFGYVAIEAMALGIPVVAAAVGGLCEIIQDEKNGLFFQSEDFRGLAARLLLIASNEKVRSQLFLEGRKTVESSFNQRQMIKKVDELYYQLCDRLEGS